MLIWESRLWAERATVAVQAPATPHEVRLSEIEAWLQSGGKRPAEQALKVRLGEAVACKTNWTGR